MSKYLVTGGGGFIGSHLVEALLGDGQEVRVLDNFMTGLRSNLEPFTGRFEMVEADLRDAAAVRQAVRGVDYILHQGALPSVPRSVRDPLESNAVNCDGTLNVLNAARDEEVKRVVYASSSSAYGDIEGEKKHEEMPANPISPYGVSKTAAEFYCRSFYRVYGLETVCLRYFNVFGPRQNHDSPYTGVLAIFIPQMLQGQCPTILGDGSASRDFTYVRNNVEANLLACTAPGAAGEVMNIACGEERTVLEVAHAINDILGTAFEPEFAPARTGDIAHSRADISKARRVLGYEARHGFREGLEQTVEWYRAAIG